MHFYKYQGTGNDFVLVDDRQNTLGALSQNFIHSICERRFGVGADGFMILRNKEGYDFEMLYYNADGNPGSMCGNGGRCMVQFANDMGITKNDYFFLAPDGNHHAHLNGDGTVSLKMSDVANVQRFGDDYILDTGSPHYVKKVQDLDNLDVYAEGRKIRYSTNFKDKGINVNFTYALKEHTLKVRTYERGVENETYSCGTGVTACAIALYYNENGLNSLDIETRGGILTVSYDRNIAAGSYTNIWLKGGVEKVFEGSLPFYKL